MRGPHALRLAAGIALALLAGCETRYPGEPPLREVRTERDRLFIRCTVNDPAFVTPPCRQFAGKDR
ncbi:hypothetical protein M1105_09095 [Limibaculum sp. FT325]|uniref:hypothetical protein n=1 Tax=Thermohalobaculum sediminis TaxID=2939436 RepID=UPI0020C0460F|nr:hypothetical protein [Limibaculum sediminis]MCL5777141.1 hypothetical protein [Limibaculum sediminis]